MNVGQRVMLVGPMSRAYCTPPLVPPPAGSVGSIAEPIDCDGDYFVLFDDFPCPVGEPEWCVHHTLLIPLDDDGYPVQSVTDSLVTS